MADEEKAEAGAGSKETAGAAPPDDGDMLTVLREIRDTQRELSDRQAHFLWLLIPIFALLAVQAVLLLVRL